MKIIHRPIQHLYPLEVCSEPSESGSIAEEDSHASDTPVTEDSDSTRPRSTRKAVVQARDRIVGITMDDD